MSTYAKPVSYGPSSAADPNEGRRLGGAFGVSASVHVVVFGVVLFLSLAVQDRIEEKPKIFELVAGEGDDFMATEAPSGSEAGQAESGEIQFKSPVDVPTWTPPAPEPEPVAPVAPPEPPPLPVTKVEPVPSEPVKPVVEPPPVPAPNFARQIKRTIQKEKAKADKEIKKQREAEARAAKERELASKRMTHAEYLASQRGKTSPSQRVSGGGTGAPGPRIDASGIKKGVTGGTGAGSKGAGGNALTAAEGERMARYDSMLIQRLREAHEKPGGLSDLLTADVLFTMAANGSFSGVRIVRSSGNPDFDQSVLEAFGRVKMPARPDGKTEVITLTFRMKEL
jgi:colicin import membrane protein